MFPGFANPAGTQRFVARFPLEAQARFYRPAQDLTVSTVGIGTYLGAMDEATDAAYSRAIRRALDGGVNFIDTSLNYRNQRSERAVALALSTWIHDTGGARDEIVVCTKAGYLVPDAVPAGVLRPEDVVGGMHCLAPAFLADQLERSRHNLGLETIDVFYLHNPETQLGYVSEDVFHARIQLSFEWLEERVAAGQIRYYGAATWEGFRRSGQGALSLERLNAIAREVGGDFHHFRFIQLPVNLAMTESRAILELSPTLGLTVVASASLLQGRLSRGLPDEIAQGMPQTTSDAERAIQFTRSMPGVSVALVGMSKTEHVEANLRLARIPPIDPGEFARVFA
jgi:aryl-alcohol dehydrogenase-like predicted oxidoreductase